MTVAYAVSPGWPGLIEAYRARLPVSDTTPVVTLQRGRHAAGAGAGALPADRLRRLPEGRGRQPDRLLQGPRHDDGHLQGRRGGRRRRSSAPRPATPAPARPRTPPAPGCCAVLVPQGKIATGKLAQALVHGAKLLQVEGNFDDCLALARKLADRLPGHPGQLGQPVPHRGAEDRRVRDRRRARRRARHPLPAGRQRGQHHRLLAGLPRVRRRRHAPRRTPRMWGFQAAGAAPIVPGKVVENPSTIATAIRIGNPASWTKALAARDESGGRIDAVTDRADPGRLPAARPHRGRLRRAGVGGSVAGLLQVARGRRARTRASGSSARSPATGSRTPSGRISGTRRRDPVTRRRPTRAAAAAATPRLCEPCPTQPSPGRPGPGPGHQRQPRPGLRLRRAGARPARRRRVRGRAVAGLDVEVAGVGRRRAAHRRVAPRGARLPRGLRRARLEPPGLRAGLRATRSRRAGGWARRPRRSSPGWSAAWALCPDVERARRRRRPPARRPRSRATRTTSAACLLGGAHPVVDRADRRRAPIRLDVDPRVRAVVLVPTSTAVHARRPAACCPSRSRTPTPRSTPAGPRCWCTRSPAEPLLLLDATEDRLHQRQRAAAMPRLDRAGGPAARGRARRRRLRGRAEPCWCSPAATAGGDNRGRSHARRGGPCSRWRWMPTVPVC